MDDSHTHTHKTKDVIDDLSMIAFTIISGIRGDITYSCVELVFTLWLMADLILIVDQGPGMKGGFFFFTRNDSASVQVLKLQLRILISERKLNLID